MTKNAFFSLLAHTMQLSSVTFCDKTPGIASVSGQDTNNAYGRTDVNVEIVM